VEVSGDGTEFGSILTLQLGGSATLPATTISARISASAAAGSISGNISNASPGAAERDVSVSGTVHAATPSLTVSPPTPDLGTTVAGTVGNVRTFTISGSGLTADVLITPPAGVEASGDGTTFGSSLTLMLGGSATLPATTIYVRISDSATLGSISGDI